MNRYIKGLFKNLANRAISFLALVDDKSQISKLAKINRFARIVDSKIGSYSYIGINTWIINSEVGKFCSIATDVSVGLAEHTLSYISTSPIFTETPNGAGHSWIDKSLINPSKPTYIGNDVWIGFRALIKSGVTIGNGAIIGAGAIVTKDVPPYAIVAGVPAKIIRYRFSQEIIAELENLKWWDWNENDLKENISSFQNDSVEIGINKLSNIKWGGVNLQFKLNDKERRVA